MGAGHWHSDHRRRLPALLSLKRHRQDAKTVVLIAVVCVLREREPTQADCLHHIASYEMTGAWQARARSKCALMEAQPAGPREDARNVSRDNSSSPNHFASGHEPQVPGLASQSLQSSRGSCAIFHQKPPEKHIAPTRACHECWHNLRGPCVTLCHLRFLLAAALHSSAHGRRGAARTGSPGLFAAGARRANAPVSTYVRWRARMDDRT